MMPSVRGSRSKSFPATSMKFDGSRSRSAPADAGNAGALAEPDVVVWNTAS